jgi:hypothetical protein
LSLRLVLQAATSLHGSAAAMATFVELGWASFATPCFSTIRSWLLRIGLFALTRPLDKSKAWLWLIDHSVQVGVVKLLVILGCPLDQVPFGERALQLSDLSLIALVPMEQSNGNLVERQVEVAALRTGRPALIASDQGGDLLKGINDYREIRPDVAHVPDIAHYGANLLQNAWQDDPRWQQFIAKLQETATKLRQSKEAFLMAPRLRPKARFMNIGTQLRFAARVLGHLSSAKANGKVIEHYSWLSDFRVELAVWFREHALVETTIALLRVDGLNWATMPELQETWSELGRRESMRQSTMKIMDGVRKYVSEYQPKEAGVSYVASTEILESSFGKLKRIEGQQSQDGITGLALAMGAIVGKMDDEEIRAALEAVPEKKVKGWLERTLGGTVQWFRKQFFANNQV